MDSDQGIPIFQPRKTQLVPIEKVQDKRPRFEARNHDPHDIDHLAISIKTLGLLTPVVLRQRGDVYELVMGNRRIRAVASLGSPVIEAFVVRSIEDAVAMLMTITENHLRKPRNVLEEAKDLVEYDDLLKALSLRVLGGDGSNQYQTRRQTLPLCPQCADLDGLGCPPADEDRWAAMAALGLTVDTTAQAGAPCDCNTGSGRN
jgi:hypothetical protein